MNALSQSLFFALAAAFANVLGGVIVTSNKWAHRSLRYFIALGAGFMLGTVFLEMFPESLALTKSAPMLFLLGYLIVHMFEHTFASHLHFGEETHHDEVTDPVVGISALVGMIVHTFFDGVAIGAGFVVSPGVGLLIFLAVLLHKIRDFQIRNPESEIRNISGFGLLTLILFQHTCQYRSWRGTLFFGFFLALDTQCCPRYGHQALLVDILAATHTLAILAAIHPFQ